MSQVSLNAVTKFSANDKLTGAVVRMQTAVTGFASKTTAGLAMIERQERKVRAGFDKLTGSLGKLGIAFGAMMLVQSVAKANIDLDASLASLRAITGVTGKEFEAFETKIYAVAKAQKEFRGDVAKAFETVANQMPELLKNADALTMVTDAAMKLSKASGDDLATAAGNVTSILNQFTLGADQASRAANVLAAGATAGSVDITLIAEALKNVGAVAATSNMSIEQTVAVLETIGKYQLKGAEAGTKLRGAINKLQEAQLGYTSGQFSLNDALDEAKSKYDALGKARYKDAFLTKLFGLENKTAGIILLNNIGLYKDLTTAVTGTNAVTDMMNEKTNTIARRLLEVKNAFLNETTAATASRVNMDKLKTMLIYVADNMDKVIGAVISGVKWFLIYKGVILATKAVMIAYNLITGITGALTGIVAISVGKSTIAMAAYNIAVKAITAVQWLWNAAMAANPIGLIIVGIAALIGVVAVIIKKWNTWGAALAVFTGPLGFVISLIQAFRRNWEMLKNAFKTEGILGGLKAIGKIILDALIMPIQQLLRLISKIPGIGKYVSPAVDRMQSWRENLGVNTTTNESGGPLNADATIERVRTERIEKTQKNYVEIGVKAMPGTSANILQDSGTGVKLTPNLGWMQ